MKIVEDKVTVYPPHAIFKKDIPVILSALPNEWTSGITSVRLSAAHGENPHIIAWYYPPDGTLTIKSRECSKEETVGAILKAIVGNALGMTFIRWGRLSKRDDARVQRIIEPFIETILPNLSQKKLWLEHPRKIREN